MLKIEYLDPHALQFNPHNARNHPNRQVGQLGNCMQTVGFLAPVVADEKNVLLAGEARILAARKIGLKKVPVVRAEGLSEAKKRAFLIAENRLREAGGWNRRKLAEELPELQELLLNEKLDIEITGFAPAEIDILTIDLEKDSSDPVDNVRSLLSEHAVSKQGDVWKLGAHLLACRDARDEDALHQLMGKRRAAMAVLDPPWNRKASSIGGRGAVKHRDFAMAAGEMSPAEFRVFLKDGLQPAISVSRDGAVHFCFMDWRGIGDLIRVGLQIYGAYLNLAVWDKGAGGMGSLYRSQHELIGIFRVGEGPHANNVELGRHGRSRTNVWAYRGLNAFGKGRLEKLRSHPTPKPVAMIVDAIKDCTGRNEVIIDTFSGGGSTLLAAERVGRRAVCVEIEPCYVDLTIRRWQQFTGRDAIHRESGKCFDELETRATSRRSKRRAA